MSRTPLFSSLRRIAQQSLTGAPDPGRRQFVKSAVASLAVASLPGCSLFRSRFQGRPPRIAVVGAGLSGVSCAYRLAQAGVPSEIFEASSRIGGRCFSLRKHFANDQVAELGGELIDTTHQSVFRLASELGLFLDDCRAGSADPDHFIIDGRPIREQSLVHEFQPLSRSLLQARALADKNPRAYQELDSLSIDEWLDRQKDVDKKLIRLLQNAYRGEFGLETSEQSAANLIYFIEPDTTAGFQVFGDSDERFHLRGGNDRLVQGMASKLLRPPYGGHALVSVKARFSDYLLSFDTGSKVIDEPFEIVVLALPFTVLREVDLSQADFRKDKLFHIQTLGYGTNAKIMSGYASRPWTKKTDNISLIADDPLQTVWETSRGQSGKTGILTNFLGGNRGLESGLGSAQEQFDPSLSELEKLFPGCEKAYFEEKTVRMHWPSHPHTKGSYSCYKPGQARFAGLEGRREGDVFFCGEHCSENFQGFMEGAIETGERVAREILGELG